jgi:hypothetical protein
MKNRLSVPAAQNYRHPATPAPSRRSLPAPGRASHLRIAAYSECRPHDQLSCLASAGPDAARASPREALPRPSPDGESPSQQIDTIIRESSGWRGKKLSELRAIIQHADPLVVEEVKWKKSSKPEGVPVWSHAGIVCVGDTLKNAVRLTFPQGTQMKDPTKLFNTRLDSNTVRAIDFHEGDSVDEAALESLILEAVRLNTRESASQ